MSSIQNILSTLNFYFLYVDKYDFPSTWIFPSAMIPYTMFRYILKGSAEFIVNGRVYMVKKDDLVYLPEKCILQCQAKSNFKFISVRVATISHDDKSCLFEDYLGLNIVNNCDEVEIMHYFENILKYAISKEKGRKLRIRAMLYLIVAWLVEHGKSPANTELEQINTNISAEVFRRAIPKSISYASDPRIYTIMEHILANPEKNFSTEDLCSMSNLSASSMRKLFKKYTGKSPRGFINELKMMTAARRLIITDDMVSIIAFDLGFDDPNYFSRCFKKVFGLSPKEYRLLEA